MRSFVASIITGWIEEWNIGENIASRLKKMVLGIALLPLVALASWYTVCFLPHLDELKILSRRGIQSIAHVNPSLYSLAVAGETKERIRSYAMSQAYWSLVYKKKRSSMLSWHANNVLWHAASYLHFQEKEIFGIWVECALYECELGLKEAARHHFGKELDRFTERDLAGLIAVVRSPTRYAPDSKEGEQMTNEILAKAKAH